MATPLICLKISPENVKQLSVKTSSAKRSSVSVEGSLTVRWSKKHLQTSTFYLKPKIHKPNNPGRPIISACSCPTELTSSFLDKKMAPFVKSLPTYIKDTNHALNILKQFSFPGNNKFLFTMDITSLYTVIPNNEGLSALKYFFDQRTVKEPSTDTLFRLAELVLTLNCFTFSGTNP